MTSWLPCLAIQQVDNGTDERQEEIVHVGLRGCPVSAWENTDSFSTSQQTFCNVHGPQFDTAELEVHLKTFLILPLYSSL
jgi:hypothetical protein